MRVWLAAAAAAAVLIGTLPHGIGLSPDSAAYLSAASNLVEGKGLIQYDGEPLLRWPPLLSVALAAFEAAGLDPAGAMPFFNAALFALFVLMSHELFRRSGIGPGLSLFGAAAVATSAPLLDACSWLLSEPLFIFCVLGFLLALAEPERPALAALFAALGFLTRYIGGALILTGVAVFLMRRRMKACVAFALLSGIPAALWLLRNRLLTQTATGLRGASERGLGENLALFFDTLTTWFLPHGLPLGVRVLLVAAGMAALLVVSKRGEALRCAGAVPPSSTDAGRPQGETLRRAMPAGIFAAIYSVMLLYTATTVHFDPISERFVVMLFVPVLHVLLACLDTVPPRKAMAVVAAVWLLYCGARSAVHVRRYARDGVGADVLGYRGIAWRRSHTLALVRQARPAGPIYSNGAAALYALCGVESKFLPRTPSEKALLVSEVMTRGRATIVWLDALPAGAMATPGELGRMLRVSLLGRLGDGAVYELLPPGSN